MIFFARPSAAHGAEALRDGDTIYLDLLGPKLQGVQHQYTIKGRIAEYDAPPGKTPEGIAATNAFRAWLALAEQMSGHWYLRVETHGVEKYGRELVTIYRLDGSSVGMALFDTGHATRWNDR